MTDTNAPAPESGAFVQPEIKPKHAYLDGPRSLMGLYRWFKYGYIAYLAITSLLMITLGTFFISFFTNIGGTSWSITLMERYSILLGGIAIATLIVYVFCIIMTCRMTYRSMRNLHTVGSTYVENSPGMSVAYYFIPFVNLVMPARVTSDIYRGTMRVTDGIIKNGRISIWWTCWLISTFGGRIADRLDPGLFAGLLSVASIAFSLAAATMLLLIFGQITKAQEDLKHGGVASVFD